MKIFLLIIIQFIIVLLVSCKTTDKKNTMQTENSKPTPTFAEIDEINASIDSSFADKENGELLTQMMKMAVENPDAFLSNLDKAVENVLYVYPNPTSGSVTVEFLHDFPFDISSMENGNSINVSLDLYYMNKKINTLDFSNISDRKVNISANYLQKNGTYTIKWGDITTSFVVRH